MECEIEKEITFDCPEGVFRCSLDEVKKVPACKNGEHIMETRLVFVVQVPWINKTVKAGRNFDPRKKDLQFFLKQWLGEELQNYCKDGKLQLDLLVGCAGEIITSHQHNHNYKKPFVKIEQLHPSGTLDLTETSGASPTDQPSAPARNTNTSMRPFAGMYGLTDAAKIAAVAQKLTSRQHEKQRTQTK